MQTNTTRHDDTEIEPLVPIMPRADTETPPRTPPREERPTDTTYATSYTRDTEEILPMVPRL